jgi:hypothetical protein
MLQSHVGLLDEQALAPGGGSMDMQGTITVVLLIALGLALAELAHVWWQERRAIHDAKSEIARTDA